MAVIPRFLRTMSKVVENEIMSMMIVMCMMIHQLRTFLEERSVVFNQIDTHPNKKPWHAQNWWKNLEKALDQDTNNEALEQKVVNKNNFKFSKF